MSQHAFFDFIIQGDDLDVNAAKREIGLPCIIFLKGQKTFAESINRDIISRSTRWVYSAEEICNKPGVFLKKQLDIILRKLVELRQYIEKFNTSMELTIYAGNKTDITLDAKHIELLNRIGVSFSISFC